MIVRIETDRRALIDFIVAEDYPFADQWSVSHLSRCAMVRIETRSAVVAYAWGHWLEPGVMNAHFCARSDARLDWPLLISKLDDVAVLFGADELVVGFDLHPRGFAMARLARRLGFDSPANHSWRDETEVLFFRKRFHGKDFLTPEAPEAA